MSDADNQIGGSGDPKWEPSESEAQKSDRCGRKGDRLGDRPSSGHVDDVDS
jgi:hypothetical protein